jgi:hypothetical protein
MDHWCVIRFKLYFDQIVLRRGEKTATPPPLCCVYTRCATQFAADVGCHHSHLSRSLLFHWTEKDDANEKGFTQTKNRNIQEWERERTKGRRRKRRDIGQNQPKAGTDWIHNGQQQSIWIRYQLINGFEAKRSAHTDRRSFDILHSPFPHIITLKIMRCTM